MIPVFDDPDEENGERSDTVLSCPRLICTLEITPRGNVFAETFA